MGGDLWCNGDLINSTVLNMAQAPTSDWRRRNPQAFLHGLAFRLIPWCSDEPAWDHDHGEFCFAKLAPEGPPSAAHTGYASLDLKVWVCEDCFPDFVEEFEWQVIS